MQSNLTATPPNHQSKCWRFWTRNPPTLNTLNLPHLQRRSFTRPCHTPTPNLMVSPSSIKGNPVQTIMTFSINKYSSKPKLNTTMPNSKIKQFSIKLKNVNYTLQFNIHLHFNRHHVLSQWHPNETPTPFSLYESIYFLKHLQSKWTSSVYRKSNISLRPALTIKVARLSNKSEWHSAAHSWYWC